MHSAAGMACRAEARGNQPVFALRASTRQPSLASRAKAGGADRDRTDDLMLAKHALSQLSYGPESLDWLGGSPSLLLRSFDAAAFA
jgi:hypothetical protein